MKVNRDLIRGSFVLLVAFGLYNIFNFIFQFSMVRMLSISDYAILATLFSIIYILSVFTESIQTVITKYSSKERDRSNLKDILVKSFRKVSYFSLGFFIFYLIISIPLSTLLDINYFLLAFNGVIIFAAFLLPVSRGLMQGKKRFFSLGGNMVLESIIKLILAIFFVFLGLRVFGAILGTVIGFVFAFSLSFIPLKDILKSKRKKSETIGIYDYTRPTFFVMLLIIAFYSIDIIMAKIVFPGEIAGAYAIASILSKAIFWGTQPISRAMFPLTAENAKNKKKAESVFGNAMLILSLIVIIALSLFYFFPSFIVNIFSGRDVALAISSLFFLGIAASLISLTNLVLLYKLSLNKTRGYPYLYIFLIIEIFLMLYFSSNLLEFSISYIVSSTIFLGGSIVLMNKS